MNSKLVELHVAEKDSIYEKASPMLFGDQFAKEAKEREDQQRALDRATNRTYFQRPQNLQSCHPHYFDQQHQGSTSSQLPQQQPTPTHLPRHKHPSYHPFRLQALTIPQPSCHQRWSRRSLTSSSSWLPPITHPPPCPGHLPMDGAILADGSGASHTLSREGPQTRGWHEPKLPRLPVRSRKGTLPAIPIHKEKKTLPQGREEKASEEETN